MIKRGLGKIIKLFHRPPDFIVGGKDNPYMLRWWIIPRNRFFNIYLHKFLRSDDDRALHDHPWHSLSIILHGGYWEHTKDNIYTRAPGHVVFRRPEQAHRVQLFPVIALPFACAMVGEFPAWTLFITGPRLREWGFHCPQGWRHHTKFTHPDDPGSIGPGCD